MQDSAYEDSSADRIVTLCNYIYGTGECVPASRQAWEWVVLSTVAATINPAVPLKRAETRFLVCRMLPFERDVFTQEEEDACVNTFVGFFDDNEQLYTEGVRAWIKCFITGLGQRHDNLITCTLIIIRPSILLLGGTIESCELLFAVACGDFQAHLQKRLTHTRTHTNRLPRSQMEDRKALYAGVASGPSLSSAHFLRDAKEEGVVLVRAQYKQLHFGPFTGEADDVKKKVSQLITTVITSIVVILVSFCRCRAPSPASLQCTSLTMLGG